MFLLHDEINLTSFSMDFLINFSSKIDFSETQ